MKKCLKMWQANNSGLALKGSFKDSYRGTNQRTFQGPRQNLLIFQSKNVCIQVEFFILHIQHPELLPDFQDQDGNRPDDHKDPDDESERTTPGKSPKSPQKSSKRLKTVPFKVTLLDGSNYEADIEVR